MCYQTLDIVLAGLGILSKPQSSIAISPLSPNDDQSQLSPGNIHTLSRD